MNNDFGFFGRKREIDELLVLHALGKHVLIVGPPGIGKTALLRHVRQHCSLLLCEETSTLRRVCDSLERQLGWAHHKLDLIKRKNRLLVYLLRLGEPVVFDQVSRTPPRIARFIAHLAEQIPIWIVCRSNQPHDIGHIWSQLYKFVRIELLPLAENETRALVEETVAQGNIQPDARKHADELHRMSGGNPGILGKLLIELAAREYKIDSSFGLDLLDLDRRIREIDLAVKASAPTLPTR